MSLPANASQHYFCAQKLFYEINDRIIIQDISLQLDAGDILFIEGKNGSGKTTLLRLLCGIMPADAGDIYWQSSPLTEARYEFNHQLSYIGHATGVKVELTALENLKFFSSLGKPLSDIPAEQALDWAGLSAVKDSPGRYLSYGQQRRVALARLKLEKTRIWVLDEPFSGLDQEMISTLKSCFLEHVDSGGILIFTSHQEFSFDDKRTIKTLALGAGA